MHVIVWDLGIVCILIAVWENIGCMLLYGTLVLDAFSCMGKYWMDFNSCMGKYWMHLVVWENIGCIKLYENIGMC